MSRNPKRVGGATTALIILLILLMLGLTGFFIWLSIDLVNQPAPVPTVSPAAQAQPSEAPSALTEPQETVPPTTLPPPEPEKVVATATIASQGDLLMHLPVINTCIVNGSYDFSSIFKFAKEEISSYDYALANLETTLGGPDCGTPYQGNPFFNCPDSIVDSVIDAGYDMLLTANNHSGDTWANGILRTLEQVRGKGLATVGTQMDAEEKKYTMVNVNGIQLGMLCYTYASGVTGDGRPSLNGNMALAKSGIINFFVESNLPAFYSDVENQIAAMRSEGAEAILLYIHWGIEYQLKENATQRAIAQKLCDLGVDAIIGGHPHVVEPVALIQSTVDPDHHAVCIYSMGNAVSNQRTGVSSLFPAGYTEDGAMFTLTFEKYSDGKVYLAGTNVVPTWVNMHSNNSPREYNILPLVKEREDEWKDLYELTGEQLTNAKKSYDRTMGIVGEGLEQCQTYLAEAKDAREQYYYDLAWNPEKLAAPAVTVPATVPEDAAA